MEHLCQRIVEHFEADWPQTLWQWERLQAEIRAMGKDWSEEHPGGVVSVHMDDVLPEPASVIRLARDCDIPSVLPRAAYHLSRLSALHNHAQEDL